MKPIAIILAVAFLLWPSTTVSSTVSNKQIIDYMLPVVKVSNQFIMTISDGQKKPIQLIGNGQCIDYVKYKLGIEGEQWISPKYLIDHHKDFGLIEINEPIANALVITHEGPVGHIAFIESVTQNMIRISEQNYVYRQYSERSLDKDADQIQGYYTMIDRQQDESLSPSQFGVVSFQITNINE